MNAVQKGIKGTDIAVLTKLASHAKISFRSFIHFLWPQSSEQGYVVADVHEYLIKLVQDTFDGTINPHQIVSMSPQHGKSRLLSVRAVAWIIGAKPGIHLAMTGFSTSLLTTFVAEAKAIISSSRYKLIFGNIEPMEGMDRANDVVFNNGSNIQARSCGSKLTGRRVDWLIVDDPHAGREEAESPTQRKRVSQWFFADCISRISNNAKIFIVATRWHPEDLIGSLTGEEGRKTLVDAGYEKWTFNHVNLSAIAEYNDPLGRKEGEALFPQQRPIEYLLGIKALMPTYEWESQYMGRPRAASGEQVDISQIKMINITEVPLDAEWVIGWDLAITEKQSADYTAGVLCAMKHEWVESTEWSEYERRMMPKRKKVEYFYIIEAFRAQKAWAQMRKMVLENCRRVRSVYGVGRAGIEAVSGFDAVYQDVKQELMGEMFVQKANPGKGGKLMRAQMWLNLIQAGRVFLVKGSWNQNYLSELSMFPQGTNDDQIDATSVCYQMLCKRQEKLMIA